MGNDELRAAAERVRDYCKDWFLTHRGKDLAGLLDASKVAEAYIAEHPANDGEPVTESELLRALHDQDATVGRQAGTVYVTADFAITTRGQLCRLLSLLKETARD